MAITVLELIHLKPGAWITAKADRNTGTLRAKGGAKTARFYFRYLDSQGRYDDLPLGPFDARGRDGLSLDQAQVKAGELNRRYRDGTHDLRLILESERREAEERRLASEAEAKHAAEAKARKAGATLGVLLTAYVDDMRRRGKDSARAVQLSLGLHVEKACPSLWNTPVDDITADNLMDIVSPLAHAGKLREAAKLQAYLRAAFAAAMRARRSAQSLPALRDLKIRNNPAAELEPAEGSNEVRERALSLTELRAYWKRICALPDPDGALLRFHLLTGTQRVVQLSRIQMDDYDQDSHTVRIRDGKGRRRLPRIHTVPLIPAARIALQDMQGGSAGPYIFTVTAGHTAAVYATLQHRLRAVVQAMQTAGELEAGIFTPGDLRRTVETRLAAAGVSLEVRAQLQSHGLGGVQAKHYDRHGYLPEKVAALETLYRLLEDQAANVVDIRGKRVEV